MFLYGVPSWDRSSCLDEIHANARDKNETTVFVMLTGTPLLDFVFPLSFAGEVRLSRELHRLKAETLSFQTLPVLTSKDASIESYGSMKFRDILISFVTHIKLYLASHPHTINFDIPWIPRCR